MRLVNKSFGNGVTLEDLENVIEGSFVELFVDKTDRSIYIKSEILSTYCQWVSLTTGASCNSEELLGIEEDVNGELRFITVDEIVYKFK